MIDYSDFKKCLKIGQIFERKAQLKICEYYKNKYFVDHENDTYEHDFMLSNGKKEGYVIDILILKQCGRVI